MRALQIMAVAGSLAAGAALASAHDSRDTQDMRDQAALTKALAGLTPGKPTSCVDFASTTLNTRVYGKTLLYSSGSGRVWRTETAGGCEAAARGDIIVQVEHQGRPCSGDILRTVDSQSRMPTGSCAIGDFTPYTKPR